MVGSLSSRLCILGRGKEGRVTRWRNDGVWLTLRETEFISLEGYCLLQITRCFSPICIPDSVV